MATKHFSLNEINEKALAICQKIESMFDKHLKTYPEVNMYEPLILRDTEIMPLIIESMNVKYPFLDPADLQYAIAILNATIFRLENKLLQRGFKPTAQQGVIASMTYRITKGYWYRDDQHWSSIAPIIILDIEAN